MTLNQASGEIEAPIVHDYDRDLIYISSMNEQDEEEEDAHPGHDLYAVNPVDGSISFKEWFFRLDLIYPSIAIYLHF